MCTSIVKLAMYIVLVLILLCGPAIGVATLSCYIPPNIQQNFHTDAIIDVSTDFGKIVRKVPSSVFFPTNAEDIRMLISASFNCSEPYVVGTRGNSHSTAGQAMAENGVVVDMRELRKKTTDTGIRVADDRSYADVGGEVQWFEVLDATLLKGRMPLTFTDYLKLSVGGTLSNAGISGHAFRRGPLISNVLELDVVTGKGDLVTCSATRNSELFFSVLGGLGQFGVITRARIPLQPAKQRALWVVMLYNDFSQFTKEQEFLIALKGTKALGFVEGLVFLENGLPSIWETTFPESYHPQIRILLKKYGVLYCLDIVEPYATSESQAAQKKIKSIMKVLSPISETVSMVDVPYVDFLKRVPDQEHTTLPHPYMNLLVPKSGISEFNSGVFRKMILPGNITLGRTLLFPLNRNKWNPRMSVAIPNEQVFYAVWFFHECSQADVESYENLNNKILAFCKSRGIQVRKYLPSYATKDQWIEHFGRNWPTFSRRKDDFDPKHMLGPGLGIFN